MADGRVNNGGHPTNGGRKSAKDEKLIASVVNMSWERIRKGLEQKYWSEKKKDEVAEHFALKSMPKDLKLQGDVKIAITGINMVTPYGDHIKTDEETV
jgi:hypothetical protein|tara:strand:- start:861 stop:1154 length:294 start_codon:yes stop_codon:yes gene_type:complete